MRPLGSSGLTSFSGRSFTVPVMRSTHSARASCAVAWARSACAGLSTTCTLPVSSRRSMKTSLPWSRRACTQPATVTVSPIAFGRFLIHVLALIRTDAEQYIVNFLNTIVVSTIYRFAYILHLLHRDRTGTLRSILEDGVYRAEVARNRGAAFAQRRNERADTLNQHALTLCVAQPPFFVAPAYFRERVTGAEFV